MGKNMRSAFICSAILLFSGCATVSMTSGETVVATEVSAQQSALRVASNDFCDNAEERGWVSKATSIFGFANRLINGQKSDENVEPARDYAELIGADTNAPGQVFSRIEQDAEEARAGLIKVTGKASKVLAGDAKTAGRGDVMSYERALVNAQKSHRAFSRAADVAAMRAGGVPEETEAALASLASEIDAARETADVLADRYASFKIAASS